MRWGNPVPVEVTSACGRKIWETRAFLPGSLGNSPHWWAVWNPAGGVLVGGEERSVLKGRETRRDHLSILHLPG